MSKNVISNCISNKRCIIYLGTPGFPNKGITIGSINKLIECTSQEDFLEKLQKSCEKLQHIFQLTANTHTHH